MTRRGGRLLAIVAIVVGAGFAAPLVYLGLRVADLGVADGAFGGPMRRTLVLAASVAVASMLLGTAQAWVLWRTDLPARRWLRMLAPLPLVIPSFVGASALLAAFAPGGLLDEALSPLGVDRLPSVDGFRGAFLVLTLLTTPYVLLPVSARLRGLPPSLEESARLLGRRPRSVFTTVVLPQILPAISSGALLVFLYVLSDFGAVALLRYDTATRAIYSARLFDQPTSATLSLALGALALMVVVAERSAARRMPLVEVARARTPLEVPLGRWMPAGMAVAVTPVVLGLLAPVGVLGWWAFRSTGSRSVLASVGDRAGALGAPTLDTALVSILAAAVTVLVVLPVAHLAARRAGRTSAVATSLVLAGFALPGLVIALALVFFSLELPEAFPLYQTLPLLVGAYVLHFGAQALGASHGAYAGAPARLVEASSLLGAGPWRRFRTIELPLLAPGLLAGGGLVLLSCMKELPATLLLAPFGFETLATRIWHANEDGFLGDVGFSSLALLLLSFALFRLVGTAERRPPA